MGPERRIPGFTDQPPKQQNVSTSQERKRRAPAPHNLGLLKGGSPCPFCSRIRLWIAAILSQHKICWEEAGAVQERKKFVKRDRFSIWVSQTLSVRPTCQKVWDWVPALSFLALGKSLNFSEWQLSYLQSRILIISPRWGHWGVKLDDVYNTPGPVPMSIQWDCD